MEEGNSNKQVTMAVVVVIGIALIIYFFMDSNNNDSSSPFRQSRTTTQSRIDLGEKEYNFDNIEKGFEGLDDITSFSDPRLKKVWEKINQSRARKQEKKKVQKAKWELHKDLINRSKAMPLILKGYEWEERELDPVYSGVTAVTTYHKNKEVVVETIITETPMDEDDLELAGNTLLKTDVTDLEPVKGLKLKNRFLDNILIYENDDVDNPVYVVRANVKGKDKEVYISIAGKGSDIKSELSKIKKGFEKMVFFDAVDKKNKKIK